MGVHGLWQLVSSTGKPVPLESLEGKVLAVDVSVWLHQLSKGMRDSSGNPVPNAHLHGLFTRICKLLYYRIKPIFVFDGGVPVLKKQTLASRRNKREEAERTSSLMQQKILTNLIRGQVLKEAYGLDKLPDVPAPVKSATKGSREAIFELPPIPESSKPILEMKSSEDKTYAKRRELRNMVEDNYEDLNQIDVESEEFKALPLEVQHEIIKDIRLGRKNYNLSRITELPEDSQDFSSFQMAKLLKYSKMNNRLDALKKELNDRQTKKLSLYYGKNFKDYDEVVSQRVMSEDSAHYLLARRNNTKNKVEETKPLFQSPMETINEKYENLLVTDSDMLLDSDDDVDVLEESKLIFNELMEKTDSGTGVESKSAADNQIHGSTAKRRFDEQKPRFKAVIEIESDSDSDNTETFGRSSEKERFGSELVEDDFHEDHELQMAIELSLRDNRNSAGGNKDAILQAEEIVVDDDISEKKSVDVLDDTNQAFKNSQEMETRLSVPVVMVKGQCSKGTRKIVGNINEDVGKSKISCKTTKKVRSSISKHDAIGTGKGKIESNGKQTGNSDVSKKTYSDMDKTYSKRIELRTVDKNEQRRGFGRNKHTLSKRKLSSMINDSNGSCEDSRKVKVIDLSDAENVSDDNMQEDSSSSEDDFIEVKVDLTKVTEDNLFPASMFDPATDINEEPLPKKPKLEPITDVQDLSQEKTDRIKTMESNMSNDLEGSFLEESSKKELDGMKQSNNEDVTVTMETVLEDNLTKNFREADNENFQVTMPTESDDDSTKSSEKDNEEFSNEKDDSVVRVDSDTEVRPPSPRVTDLAQQFESVNEQRVKDLSTNLTQENRLLRLEQGRQERLAVSITDQMHSEAQDLLQLFGIPFIISPTEAEAQCAQLELSHLSHGTITDDSDIWLFGGKCVFKNFFNQQKHVECFKEEHLSSKLGLTREALINIALLCGSDYTPGIRGVGPVTAMEILAQFPGSGLDGLKKFKSWWEKAQDQIDLHVKQPKFLNKLKELDIHSDFPSSLVVEAYLSPTVDDSCEKCTWSLPNIDMLRQFASQKLKWNLAKTDEVLLPVMKRLTEKQTQRGIMSFFQPEVFIQPAAVKSKRLQKVVNKFVNPEADVGDEPELSLKKQGSKGQKRKNDKENSDEQENATTEDKKTNKGRKRKINKSSGDSDSSQKVLDEGNKKGKKVKLDKTANEVVTVSTENMSDNSEVQGSDKTNKILNSGAKRRNTRSKKKIDDKLDSDPDRSNDRRRTRNSKLCEIDSKLNDREVNSSSGNVLSNMNSKFNDDDRCRSSDDSESDSDSGSSNSGDDLKVVQSGLNIEEILGLKMGCEMDEVDTVGSSLDVGEILNLKMGCKLDEISSGNESQKEGRVIENLVNVNEILHLDSGTDQFVAHEPEVQEFKQSEEETVEGEDETYACEGGFIRDDDSDDAKSSNETVALIEKVNILEQTEDSPKSSCLDNNSKKGKYSDSQFVEEKQSDVVNISGTSRKTRSTYSKVSCSVEHNSSNSQCVTRKALQIKEEHADTVVDNDSASFSTEVKSEPISQDCKISKTKPRSVKSKKSVKKDSVYAVEPLKPIVTGLPWADKKKGKRKVHIGKTSGLKLVPKETMVKSEKKLVPRMAIGCVNLSESDSDS